MYHDFWFMWGLHGAIQVWQVTRIQFESPLSCSDRGGSRIFLRRGCTYKEWRHWRWGKKKLKSNTYIRRGNLHLRGGVHPLHPPPRSAPEWVSYHFEILPKGRSDTHCKIKESLVIQELKPTLKRYCQQRKAFAVLVCIFYMQLFLSFYHCYN